MPVRIHSIQDVPTPFSAYHTRACLLTERAGWQTNSLRSLINTAHKLEVAIRSTSSHFHPCTKMLLYGSVRRQHSSTVEGLTNQDSCTCCPE